VLRCIKKMKREKAAGRNMFVVDLVKEADEETRNMLADVIAGYLNNGTWPEEMREGVVCSGK